MVGRHARGCRRTPPARYAREGDTHARAKYPHTRSVSRHDPYPTPPTPPPPHHPQGAPPPPQSVRPAAFFRFKRGRSSHRRDSSAPSHPGATSGFPADVSRLTRCCCAGCARAVRLVRVRASPGLHQPASDLGRYSVRCALDVSGRRYGSAFGWVRLRARAAWLGHYGERVAPAGSLDGGCGTMAATANVYPNGSTIKHSSRSWFVTRCEVGSW